MTDAVTQNRGNTRDRLTQAATTLFYEQGVGNTTLADVSEASKVPLGNIYYHFKTKDELTSAVIQKRAEYLKAALETAECETNPLDKLVAIIHDSRSQAEMLTMQGCPYTSLIHDLDKLGSDQDAAQLLQLYIDYAHVQFSALELPNPDALSVELISRLQGAFVIANALKSKDVLDTQLNRLEAWLKTLN